MQTEFYSLSPVKASATANLLASATAKASGTAMSGNTTSVTANSLVYFVRKSVGFSSIRFSLSGSIHTVNSCDTGSGTSRYRGMGFKLGGSFERVHFTEHTYRKGNVKRGPI